MRPGDATAVLVGVAIMLGAVVGARLAEAVYHFAQHL
jgi:hypothetical protein